MPEYFLIVMNNFANGRNIFYKLHELFLNFCEHFLKMLWTNFEACEHYLNAMNIFFEWDKHFLKIVRRFFLYGMDIFSTMPQNSCKCVNIFYMW